MTWYDEPTVEQVEAARAAVFLSETKKVLLSQGSADLVLRLEVRASVHNQRVYRLHATLDGFRITGPGGHNIHPITGTPLGAARMLSAYARTARRR